MKNHSALRRKTPWVLVIAMGLAYTHFAHADAQDTNPADRNSPASSVPVVVTATRTPQSLTDTLADITVLDRQALQNSGAVALGDVLARVPGIEMSRTGGPGAATSLFIRGANNEFTAVFIDGVRVDSQNLQGGANWEAIPLGLIDHIEILRGPAAAVYGSDAIGGVVQIFTQMGQGAARPYVEMGMGSYGTSKEQAGVSGSEGAFDYALDAKHERSNGFNQIPSSPPAQNDGYTTVAGHARLGFQIDPDQRLEATLLANNLLAAYNDGYGDPAQQLFYQLRTTGLNWTSRWSDNYNTQVGVSETMNQMASPYGTYATDLRNYLFLSHWHFGLHQLTLTLERREDRLTSSSSYDPIAGTGDRSDNALALGYGLHWQQHTLQLNVRHDQDSIFGGHNTGSAAYGYAFAPHWRATVSAATGYRAPTLYEQYSQYGVASLAPQTNQNLEAGLKYENNGALFSLAAYHNKVSNLINFANSGDCQSPYGCYANVGRALLEGVTLTAQQRFQAINTHASIDLQDPKDLGSGDLLARRAKTHGVLGADTLWANWTLGAEAQASGRRFNDAANTQALGGYTLFNVYVSKPLAPDWQLLARVDNLSNKHYELASTYANPGRTLYMGLKWSPH